MSDFIGAAMAAGALAAGMLVSTHDGLSSASPPGAEEQILFVVMVPDAPDRMTTVVRHMSTASGLDDASITERIEALWRETAGLYVQLDDANAPLDIVIRRIAGNDMFVDASRMTMTLRGNGRDQAAVMWIRNPERSRYVVQVPVTVSHLTIVANGRTILADERLANDPERRTIPVLPAR